MFLKCIATGSKGNSYILTDESGESLILDCGVKSKDIKQALNFDFSKVSGVLVTHNHKDHSLSAEELESYGLDVWMPERRNRKTFGSYAVSAFELPHGETPCCGFYIRHINGFKMLYLTDFQCCPYRFVKQEVNAILIECNWSKQYVDLTAANAKHKIGDHASSDVCKDFIRVNATDKLRTVILCHYSNAVDIYAEVEEIKNIVPQTNVEYAEKGKEIEL